MRSGVRSEEGTTTRRGSCDLAHRRRVLLREVCGAHHGIGSEHGLLAALHLQLPLLSQDLRREKTWASMLIVFEMTSSK